MEIFEDIGFDVLTVAGEGDCDRRVEGLGITHEVPSEAALDGGLREALLDADLTVVENLATIPLNIPASLAVGRVLAGRPAILHHHDPPWHRPQHRHVTQLPLRDPAWRHVAIHHIAAAELAERGIESSVIYNGFEMQGNGDRASTRAVLGVSDGEDLLAHPVRAIERKNLPAAIGLAEATGATYWLLGPAEDGYGDRLAELLGRARCRVVRHSWTDEADIYAAADAVLYPSSWEGFGNPPLEAALYRRHCVVGHYPFAGELRSLGFRFIDPDDTSSLRELLARPDTAALDTNEALVKEHFSLTRVREGISELLDGAGWLP